MAAQGLNEVRLIGNLGGDPQFKFLPNNNALVEFSLATAKKWKDKQTGEKKERTEWHNIVIYGKLAEVCKSFLKKGSKVYLGGEIRQQRWENQQGQKQYKTVIECDDMLMLDGKDNNSNASSSVAPNSLGNWVINPKHPSGAWKTKADVEYERNVQTAAGYNVIIGVAQ